MDSDSKFDLLVVGGGVLGTFHAYHALQRGLKVILLERNPSPQGATVRNFGQIVPSGSDLAWQQHGRRSTEIYKEIQSQFDLSVRQLGSLYIASDDDEMTLIQELAEINAGENYASEVWDADQCCRRYPELRRDYCQGGLFFPDEISVNPRQMIHRLHQFMQQQPDLEIHFQTCIAGIETESNHLEATASDGRVFHAERAIICSGTDAQLLYPDRLVSSDLTAVKLQMLRLKPQPLVSIPGNVLTGLSVRRYESFSQCPSWNEIKSREDPGSFAKQWGVHILFKQESDGGIILGDSHEYAPIETANEIGFDLREDINEYFISEAQKIFDLPSWEIESSWWGMYCQTKHPSGLFIDVIDDKVHLITGIGGKGMTSSAGFAEYYLGEMFDDSTRRV